MPGRWRKTDGKEVKIRSSQVLSVLRENGAELQGLKLNLLHLASKLKLATHTAGWFWFRASCDLRDRSQVLEEAALANPAPASVSR